ncbi:MULTISPECIES: sensor histidine kinase [unclassified Paenibacillus]|uniref:sensor histidine kinase n=1 Tax=unclassified Paenibacillus TaxID=185978 RepID=UPI000CFC81FD|nr:MULTISPECIES: sensor histidine kinase [unclassified Paenibacillus]PRA09642.1 sensor histidine kinase [Paenibacillus sp. MYb63]PRA46398.1 sensor histidine kinase [Paenibacillus sp. MYb67]
MQKWMQNFYKKTGLNLYVWLAFFILPFYFISQYSKLWTLVTGIIIILVFFVCYLLAFITKGWQVYMWIGLLIAISITMTIAYDYAYFSLFLAFFIGNIKNKAGFFTLYSVNLGASFVTINYGFINQSSLLVSQLPFVFISLMASILLPISTYNKNKTEHLEGQLENANKRLDDLVKMEERQRIARDLHDTLGQKLSLIGLKTDLARRLLRNNPDQAEIELNDLRQTASTALKEVREMVTTMRGTQLVDELFRAEQILKAASIEFVLEGNPKLQDTSQLNENVLGMCLKEAVTNVVKHSQATTCTIIIKETLADNVLTVQDNGVGIERTRKQDRRGTGILGMKERLEFVNGCLDIRSAADIPGTAIIIHVPKLVRKPIKEAES